MRSQHRQPLKIVVMGDAKTGKSTLVNIFIDDTSTNNYKPTIGADFAQKNIELGEEDILLHIWDMAGDKRYRTLSTSFYRGAAAFIITYDITNQKSFNNIQEWLDTIPKTEVERPVVFIVGTGLDLITAERPRVVEEPKQFAHSQVVNFMDEINARDKSAAASLFQQVVEKVHPHSKKTQNKENEAKQQIINKLQQYVNRIDSYKGDYAHGFWFFAQSRAINRELNYRLAVGLIEELQDENKTIDSIFNNPQNTLNDLRTPTQDQLYSMAVSKGGITPDVIKSMIRGINSSELNDIIKEAKKPKV